MSKVLGEDGFDLEYWGYPALLMEKSLKKILKKNKIKKGDVDINVHDDLSRFFELVLGAINKTKVSNPPAQREIYSFSAGIIERQNPYFDRDHINKKLTNFGKIFQSLKKKGRSNKSHQFKPIESKRLKELQNFFKEIFKLSEQEAYNSLVSSSEETDYDE